MWNNTDITKIKSDYVLKSLFCYIDYPYILKLSKNNKNLQNRLGLTFENYKNKSDSLKYEYIQKTRISKHYKHNPKMPEEAQKGLLDISILSLQGCFLLPFFIYSILLVARDTFTEKNRKENYNKKSYNIINIINPCLFIYDAFFIIDSILFICYIYNDSRHDFGKKKVIKFIIQIFMSLINILFESLVIWKLILSYQIKKGGVTWFMVLDYIFLCINFIYISGFIYSVYEYWKEAGDLVQVYTKCNLILFNNIKIEEYELPENFNKLQKKERKKYVLDRYKDFKVYISSEHKNLITTINVYRRDNGLELLGVCQCRNIPDFLIKEPSVIMLFPEQNIFKLSDKKYLFKYPIGIFEDAFHRKDRNIFNVLLKDNLNHIQIINYRNMEYIYIYELNDCRFHKTELKSSSSSGSINIKKISDRFYSYYDYDLNKKNYYE